MNPRDAYARLLALDISIVTSSEVAAALRVTPSAATMLLTRLAAAGLATRIRRGLWGIGTAQQNRYALVERLTAPMPSYVSLQSALHLRGMIEQVPSVVYVVSLGETERIKTTLGVYSVHHIAAELFDGFELMADGSKLASAEKALFDMIYFSGARSRLFAHIPELELPRDFRYRRLRQWTRRITSLRRRSMVESRLREITPRSVEA